MTIEGCSLQILVKYLGDKIGQVQLLAHIHQMQVIKYRVDELGLCQTKGIITLAMYLDSKVFIQCFFIQNLEGFPEEGDHFIEFLCVWPH